jgi:hypothetical protein
VTPRSRATRAPAMPQSHSTGAKCDRASRRLVELQERTPELRGLWDHGRGGNAANAAYYRHWQEVRAQMALCDRLRAELVAEVRADQRQCATHSSEAGARSLRKSHQQDQQLTGHPAPGNRPW